MFGIELEGDIDNGRGKQLQQWLPPGYRFHPTDEELIAFYLASKLFRLPNFHGVNIAEVDLNRCEPWELPEEARMGEREWYFFSLRVRKYLTGLRSNRATVGGYWKATGKERQIESSSSSSSSLLIGTKKTLVFYKGGAPKGLKTKWVLHEYSLHPNSHNIKIASKEEWVLCRIIHKSVEKMNKPTTFQTQQTTSLQQPLLLSLHKPQTIHNNIHNNNNNTIFQAPPPPHNPHFIFQSNHSWTGTDLFGQFDPPLLADSIACSRWDASSFVVDGGDLVDVAGGHGETDEDWSGGCL